MRKHPSIVVILAFGCLIAGSASAASNSSCTTCDYPHDNLYEYFSSNTQMTANAASLACSSQLANVPFGFDVNGFVIFGVGTPSSTGAQKFTCYACVSGEIPDPFDENLSPSNNLALENAASIAQNVYEGEATNARRVYSFNAETEEAGASFMFTLSGVPFFEGGVGIVDVDPEDGSCIRLHPINCEER